MSYGKDERHVDKHLWELPIPAFDASDPLHSELVELGRQAAALAEAYTVDPGIYFPTTRRGIRQRIEASAAGTRIAEIVYEMLS